jgi:hypothetical protein
VTSGGGASHTKFFGELGHGHRPGIGDTAEGDGLDPIDVHPGPPDDPLVGPWDGRASHHQAEAALQHLQRGGPVDHVISMSPIFAERK